MSRPLKIMLVAAEASGDALGAGLARALRARLGKDVAFVGVGGPRMTEEGVESPFDIADLSVLGWLEGLKAYGVVKRRVADTAALARAEHPDAVVLIDSWGFTIRVAKAIRAALPDTPLIKYVGPQVWASRPGRAKTLAAAGLAGVGGVAGQLILIDQPAIVEAADRLGLFVWGETPGDRT